MQRTLELTRPPFDYDKIPVTTASVIELDPIKRAYNCREVFITVETNSIRWRVDEGDPDADDGHVLIAGASLSIKDGLAIEQFKMIGTNEQAGSVVIVTYYH